MASGLVGRSEEARTVATLADDATGSPAVVIIEGEPGIGKSTLWFDAVERARSQGIRVLAARTSAAESVLAYATLADLLAGLEPDAWAHLPAPQRHGLSAALLADGDVPAPPVDQRAVGAALLAIVEDMAKHSPVLVAIDDLQWIDASSAAAVAFAARRTSGRVRFLCTARSDLGSTSGAAVEFGPPEAIRRVRLGPLSVGDLHDVLVAQLGNGLPRPRLLHVHRVSGGNPFYAVELARELDLRGGAELSLPSSLAVLTQARIGRIHGRAHEALLAIASLATPRLAAVAEALEVDPQRLADLLDEAETTGIVVIEGNRVRFTHPLLAHAVHSGATPARRRSMHRRLAGIVTEPELRARHLALSDPAGEPSTLAALDDAAVIARRRGAPAAAAGLLELAIGLGGATGRRRITLADCLFDAGDPRRARDVLEAAIAELPPGPERAEALQQLALVRLYDDGFSEVAELGRRALADCEHGSALRVEVMTTVAFAELNMGSPDAALATATRAVVEAEDLGLATPLRRALGMRAMMRFMNGEGVVPGDLVLATAGGDGDARMPLPFRPALQSTLVRGWSGDMAVARAALAEFGRRSEALGEEGEMLFIAFQLVAFDVWLGNLPGAAATADDALRRARQLGGDAAQFLALAVQGTVAAYQGRVEDARRDLAAAIAAGTGSGYVMMLTWTIATLGFLELSLGNHAAALVVFEPLLPMVQAIPRNTEILVAGFLPDAAEAMVTCGRHDEAEHLIDLLERNGTRLDRPWMLAVGAHCRALLSAARGDVAAGVAFANAALAHHDRLDMPFARARTLLVLGGLQRRQRQWQPGVAALTEALAVFERLGTPLWAAQARGQLDRGSAGRPRSMGLTPAEQRVAELAATGMTNQEIAAALFIARKTVEVNLSRIYRKLGIRSRVELFAVVNGAGREPLA